MGAMWTPRADFRDGWARTRGRKPGGERAREDGIVLADAPTPVRAYVLASLVSTLLLACQGAPSAAEPERAATESFEADFDEEARLVGAPPGEGSSEVTLEGGIRARLTPAPVNADPDRALELLDPVADLPAGTEVLEVRSTGAGWLVLRPDHGLWLHGDGPPRQLDEGVYSPMALREPWVAYARGAAPELEVGAIDLRAIDLRAVDLRDAPAPVLTAGYAPVWNPALGPHGEVVFVSGRAGVPALYRVAPGGAPERLMDEGRFPSWIEAPTYDGQVLRFREESGATAELQVRPAALAPEPAGALR